MAVNSIPSHLLLPGDDIRPFLYTSKIDESFYEGIAENEFALYDVENSQFISVGTLYLD